MEPTNDDEVQDQPVEQQPQSPPASSGVAPPTTSAEETPPVAHPTPPPAPPSAPSSAQQRVVKLPSNRSSITIRCIRGVLIFLILSLSFVLFKIVFEGEEYTGFLDDQDFESYTNTTTAVVAGENNTTSKSSTRSSKNPAEMKKLLYIVTSSSEFNNFRKKHVQHLDKDRLKTMTVPLMKEGIETMIAVGFDVDLYLVLSYTLTPERHQMVQDALPDGVNLEVWNDATPIDYDDGYRNRPPPQKVKEISRALARQHRYVVKDKLHDYDLFLAFEDDMLITGEHILHHLWLSEQLEQMKEASSEFVPRKQYGVDSSEIWFGDMARKQFPRMRPGFIRVEALLNETENPIQTKEQMENVPVDYDFSDMDGYGSDEHIDPSFCCHVKNIGLNGTTAPAKPKLPSELMLWETGISGLAVRELPDASWVGLLPGPRKFQDNPFDYKVGKYSPGNSRTLKQRPAGPSPKFLAQSAGWIMTRAQLAEMDMDLCQGSFLPPFQAPIFQKDGLYMMNVEYWSGGLQMWCPKQGCNIQRVMQLDPKNFSKHLFYHTSNNKQKAIARERRVRVDHLLGQLNTVRKDAIKAKDKLVSTKKK